MRFLTAAVLVILLCLPVYGPAYFLELVDAVGTSHTGFVCADESTDSGRESHDDHQQTAHCRELDAPCDLTSSPALDHSFAISALISSDKGTVLPGHGAPIEIPPEYHLEA
jgi:hypothetical protein